MTTQTDLQALLPEQFAELEKILLAAESEWRITNKIGKANELIQFHAVEYIRLLLNHIQMSAALSGDADNTMVKRVAKAISAVPMSDLLGDGQFPRKAAEAAIAAMRGTI